MRKLSLLVLACMIFAPAAVFAQEYEPTETEDDLQSRMGITFDKKVFKGFHISLEEELRLYNNLQSLDRIHSSLGVSYKVNKYFKVGAAYTFIARHHAGKKSTDYEKYWDLRHRAHVDLTASYKTGNWRFSFRERPQFTCRTDDIDTREKRKWDITLRHRVKVGYDIFSKPVKPYVAVELSHTLNALEVVGNHIEKVRSTAGVEWQISKRNTMDFYYRFDWVQGYDIDVKDYADGRPTRTRITKEKGRYHIIGVAYEFSF